MAILNNDQWQEALVQLANGGNMDNISLIAAVGTTTTQASADQTNYNARGILVYVNITSAGTGSISFNVHAKDPVTGLYGLLFSDGTALTANGFYVYVMYPGASGGNSRVAVGLPVPRTWRVQMGANNANPMTYTVSCSYVV